MGCIIPFIPDRMLPITALPDQMPRSPFSYGGLRFANPPYALHTTNSHCRTKSITPTGGQESLIDARLNALSQSPYSRGDTFNPVSISGSPWRSRIIFIDSK